MNKSLLVALAILVAGFTSFAGELDGDSTAANQTTRAEKNIPQTIVVRLDKDGSASVFKSDKALDFKDAQDAQNQLANAKFEKVAMADAATSQKLSELDRDQSDSSWHFFYPHNRWGWGGGVYFAPAPVYYYYSSAPAYYYNYPAPVYYDNSYYVNYAPYSYGYAWGGYNYGFFRPHFGGGYRDGGFRGGFRGGWRR